MCSRATALHCVVPQGQSDVKCRQALSGMAMALLRYDVLSLARAMVKPSLVAICNAGAEWIKVVHSEGVA